MKTAHPAFYNDSSRRHIPTSADDKHYAFLRTAKDNSERVLAVMNFQSTPQTVEVDVSGVAGEAFVDMTSSERAARKNPLPVKLPAYGYRFYRVE
jgi:Maltogenic Amylase, C-terminal domain